MIDGCILNPDFAEGLLCALCQDRSSFKDAFVQLDVRCVDFVEMEVLPNVMRSLQIWNGNQLCVSAVHSTVNPLQKGLGLKSKL